MMKNNIILIACSGICAHASLSLLRSKLDSVDIVVVDNADTFKQPAHFIERKAYIQPHLEVLPDAKFYTPKQSNKAHYKPYKSKFNKRK